MHPKSQSKIIQYFKWLQSLSVTGIDTFHCLAGSKASFFFVGHSYPKLQYLQSNYGSHDGKPVQNGTMSTSKSQLHEK